VIQTRMTLSGSGEYKALVTETDKKGAVSLTVERKDGKTVFLGYASISDMQKLVKSL